MAGYETIDLFNWQEQAKGMLSQIAFTQMVNVQSETIEWGKVLMDLGQTDIDGTQGRLTPSWQNCITWRCDLCY